MGRRSKQEVLHAFMNGQRVGMLTSRPNGSLEFQYAPEWLESGESRPISLSLPLSDTPLKGPAVLSYFDNLLPDSRQIRERIQARFGTRTARPFDLLASIGGDCVGALQLSLDESPPKTEKITATPVDDEEIAERLKSYMQTPLGMREDEGFRISIAGAQEKTAFLWHAKRWKVPHGATPTTHIFKLPIGRVGGVNLDLTTSCENEWLCMTITGAFGLPTANVELGNFDGQRVLIVERFDRRWAKGRKWLLRLPQEDMCQALAVPPGLKYESDGGPGISAIMDVLNYSEDRQHDREIFMRAMIVFWMLAAIDGHAKNFSLYIEPEGRYRMTPLYDIMSAHPLMATGQLQSQRAKLAMAVLGKNRHYAWRDILLRHWLSTAARVKFGEDAMRRVIRECFDQLEEVMAVVVAQMPEGFPDSVATPVFEGMRSVRDRFHSMAAGE